MFSDAFSREHQLIQADPKHSLYLACALLVRGNVQVSDLRRNIERFVISHQLVMVLVIETVISCPEHSHFSHGAFLYQISLLRNIFLNFQKDKNTLLSELE